MPAPAGRAYPHAAAALALEETSDFREWFRLVYGEAWDGHDSRCPLCFIVCVHVARQLRELMGADYDLFVTAALQVTAGNLPAEGDSWPTGSMEENRSTFS